MKRERDGGTEGRIESEEGVRRGRGRVRKGGVRDGEWKDGE